MRNDRSNRLATAALFMLTLFIMGAMVAALPGTLNARDRGVNQPGAAGSGRDPESTPAGGQRRAGPRNQPARSRRQCRAGSRESISPVPRATLARIPASTSPVPQAMSGEIPASTSPVPQAIREVSAANERKAEMLSKSRGERR